MVELLLILVPLAIGVALVSPTQVIALIFFLQTRLGLVNGLAYVGGMTVFHLVVGALFWTVMTGVGTSIEAGGGRFDLVVGTGLALMGLLLLAYALRRGFFAPNEDNPIAAWFEKMQSASPWQAALVGLAFLALDPKDWLFNLTAVDLIIAANLNNVASLLAYFIYIVLVQSILLALLILTLIASRRVQQWLDGLNVWLNQRLRAIEIVVAVLLGGYLVVVGFQYLALF